MMNGWLDGWTVSKSEKFSPIKDGRQNVIYLHLFLLPKLHWNPGMPELQSNDNFI